MSQFDLRKQSNQTGSRISPHKPHLSNFKAKWTIRKLKKERSKDKREGT